MQEGNNFVRLVLHCSIVLIFAVFLPLVAISNINQVATDSFPLPPQLRLDELAILKRWAVLCSALIPFYFFNTYFLLPKYLVIRKYLLYSIMVILCFILILCLSKSLEYILNPGEKSSISFVDPPLFLPMILLLGVGTSLEMVIQWENQKSNQEKIEREKVTAELSFLKSQVNPHFLFNTLNNIYSLAEQKSDKTGKSILLLASLMRYMLYDTSDGKILLSSEIKHIEEYIELQRMRIAAVKTVSVDFKNNVQAERVLIEPLIFVPFIENAFKHGISYVHNSFVKIQLSVENDVLYFNVLNSKKYSGNLYVEDQGKGVGIANVQRRLELLYPHRHKLEINDGGDSYAVSLIIKLDADEKLLIK
jgi:two-component system, LytTR family, sensor kinase